MQLAIRVLLIVAFVGLLGHVDHARITFAMAAESPADTRNAHYYPITYPVHSKLPELREIFKDRMATELDQASDINLFFFWVDATGLDGPSLIDRVKDRLVTMKWEIVNDRTDGGARWLEYIRVDCHRTTFWDSLWHEIEAGTIVHCNGKVLFADLSLYEGWWKSVSDHGKLAKKYISGYFDPDLKQYRRDLCGSE